MTIFWIVGHFDADGGGDNDGDSDGDGGSDGDIDGDGDGSRTWSQLALIRARDARSGNLLHQCFLR